MGYIMIICLFLSAGPTDAGIDSLVSAEKAFSDMSVKEGRKKAFLSNLAKDCVLFVPLPINGIEYYEKQKDAKDCLKWRPLYAEISKSGDFGYTTGPWEYRQKGKTGYGHYVSVWTKQEGMWKVVLDVGISHSKPRGVSKEVKKIANKVCAKEKNKSSLLERDKAYSKASASKGFLKVFKEWTTGDVRLYRMGALPRTGQDSALYLISKEKGKVTWSPIDGKVSRDGSMGYTYGNLEILSEGEPKKRFIYMRVWRLTPEKVWKVALEITNPMPK